MKDSQSILDILLSVQLILLLLLPLLLLLLLLLSNHLVPL